MSFRLGPEDAAVIAQEMQPTFDGLDLLNRPNHHFYIKLMIDGTPIRPFSARTLPPTFSSPRLTLARRTLIAVAFRFVGLTDFPHLP